MQDDAGVASHLVERGEPIDEERAPRLDADYTGRLPPFEQLSGEAVDVAQQLLARAQWQLVDVVHLEGVAQIEARRHFIDPQIAQRGWLGHTAAAVGRAVSQ